MRFQSRSKFEIALAVLLGFGSICLANSAVFAKDISDLDQHFNSPGQDISPRMFVPQENIRELDRKSTRLNSSHRT